MAEEPFDTYIDFGFEDETTSFSPPADEQNLPDLVVEILAALQSEPRLPQAEEPTEASTYLSVPAALSAPPSQNTSNFYHPSPTSPDPLGVASDRVYPATYVRPSDTIYVHGALLAAPAPQASSPHQYVPLVSPHPLLAKRPREQWENSSRTDQSPSQKRQRATPFYPSATDIGHPSSSINGLSHSSETVAEAAAKEPVAQSTTWGIIPRLRNNAVAGPSTVGVENAPRPRISGKRARNDENGDPSPTPNRRRKHKMVVLAEAPEVLNAPPLPYPGFYSGSDNGLLPARPGDEPPATRFVNLPELSSEFYKELCGIAFEIAQGLRQASSIDGAYTYQDAPGSSATTHPAGEDNKKGPPTTATGKRRRRQGPSEQPPQKRQRTGSSTDATTPEKPFGCPFATCPQRFGRQSDITRHVRTKHLGVGVFCMSPVHPQPVRVVREDGIFRHLAFNTCIGAQARAALVKKCENEKTKEEKEEMGDAEIKLTRRWMADVRKRVSRMFAWVGMPCYYRNGRFAAALERLPGWSPDRLEKWFSSYGEVKRCRCERCQNISDAELRGEVRIQVQDALGDITRSRSASPVARTSSPGAGTPVAGSSLHVDVTATPCDAEWDNKLPPEEEEGVDEDLPQASSPVVDTIPVAPQEKDAVGIPDPSDNVGGMCPELQAVYDILSVVLDAGLLRSPDGSQPEIDPASVDA